MADNDILQEIKNSVREELNREANAIIEKWCHKFRCELGKHKNELVAALLNNIDMNINKDTTGREVVFQIVIKGGMNNDNK